MSLAVSVSPRTANPSDIAQQEQVTTVFICRSPRFAGWMTSNGAL